MGSREDLEGYIKKYGEKKQKYTIKRIGLVTTLVLVGTMFKKKIDVIPIVVMRLNYEDNWDQG